MDYLHQKSHQKSDPLQDPRDLLKAELLRELAYQQQLRSSLTKAVQTIELMKTSRFWQLRQQWLKLQARLGLRRVEAVQGLDEMIEEICCTSLPSLVGSEGYLLDAVASHTLCSTGKLKNLIRLSEYLNSNAIPGDVVECGTCRGGSAAVLAQYLSPDRYLWLYDSFQGLPEPSERDGDAAQAWVGGCKGTIQDVQEVMQRVGIPADRYTFCKGWFQDTFQQQLPDQVALLHCDADWYDSVLLVLETFYDRVVEGGCIILDDFGCWEGCREAFYDFCYRRGEKPLLERLDDPLGGSYSQAYWIKGKTHNRLWAFSAAKSDSVA